MSELTKLQQIQDILGVTPDGIWGAKSEAALEKAIGEGHPAAGTLAATEAGPYSARFLKMIPFLWEWEGTKFEDDPDDPGGATKFGIDKRSHPAEDIRNLTEARAIAIYWKEYWQRYGCEGYQIPLGEVVFNCCVNAGWGRAKTLLDVALHTAPGGNVAERFLQEQEDFYRRLAEQRPRSQKYLKGWLNRTAALRRHLGMA